jgi:RHS repeat-associated protein
VNAVNPNGSGQSSTAQTLLNSVTYNVDGNVSGWLWSDSKARTIGYDSYGQIASYTLGDPNGSSTAAGSLRTLVRDAAGRVTAYTHTNNGSAVTSLDQGFSYDDLNRLTGQTVSSTSYAYSYDATGNRTSKTIGGTSYTNTVASTSNRYTQVQDVGGTSSVTHDSAGNITADGANSYTYSDRGRMNSATTGAGSVSFLYNGFEQRAKKTQSSGSTHYIYDEDSQLLGAYDANGVPVWETIYLESIPVGVLKQTGSAANNNVAVTLHNMHADQINTPRLITKQDHTFVWRWEAAEVFGATPPDQNPSGLGVFVFDQRGMGQVQDAETGLVDNISRQLDPRTGRYDQFDPLGLKPSINGYLHVDGRPLSDVDPLGLAGGRGERGVTGGAGGQNTNNPYKHCRELSPPEVGFVECRHHQTGKWIRKPRPEQMPFPKPKPATQGMCESVDCQRVVSVIVGGAVVFVAACTLPAWAPLLGLGALGAAAAQ